MSELLNSFKAVSFSKAYFRLNATLGAVEGITRRYASNRLQWRPTT